MGKISIKKVISDVRDAYVTASGDSDTITYGNLPTKIENMSGGISGGFVVKFKVDDDDYYIASCDFMTNTITEPPAPTKSGYVFAGWEDQDENPFEFPYNPVEQEETLYAKFTAVRTEMEVNESGTVLWSGNTKSNTGKAICGKCAPQDANYKCYLVSDTQSNIAASQSASSGDAITYNGVRYYYSKWYVNPSTADLNSAFVTVNTSSSASDATNVTKILDHYFYND